MKISNEDRKVIVLAIWSDKGMWVEGTTKFIAGCGHYTAISPQAMNFLKIYQTGSTCVACWCELDDTNEEIVYASVPGTNPSKRTLKEVMGDDYEDKTLEEVE